LNKFMRVFYLEIHTCSLVYVNLLWHIEDDGTVDVKEWNLTTRGSVIHVILELQEEGDVDEDYKQIRIICLYLQSVSDAPFNNHE